MCFIFSIQFPFLLYTLYLPVFMSSFSVFHTFFFSSIFSHSSFTCFPFSGTLSFNLLLLTGFVFDIFILVCLSFVSVCGAYFPFLMPHFTCLLSYWFLDCLNKHSFQSYSDTKPYLNTQLIYILKPLLLSQILMLCWKSDFIKYNNWWFGNRRRIQEYQTPDRLEYVHQETGPCDTSFARSELKPFLALASGIKYITEQTLSKWFIA